MTRYLTDGRMVVPVDDIGGQIGNSHVLSNPKNAKSAPAKGWTESTLEAWEEAQAEPREPRPQLDVAARNAALARLQDLGFSEAEVVALGLG